MTNYDFLSLSYFEFEELVKDLLSAELETSFESFADGADGGIDLRCFHNDDRSTIVQCKRYKKVSDLLNVLKDEIEKVKLLKPARYIIATSIDLTPKQKDSIRGLFYPYILSPADIITRKAINALLRKHPGIEKNHFKLWINSTAVLDTIFKSRIINQSKFESEYIKETLKYYVYNQSFSDSQKILEHNRFVLISGIPGIGKTTLARVLAYFYLFKMKYDEFVFLSDSINDGYDLFKEGVKQIFFFDDFLGTSFEERKLNRNEDKRMIDFIYQVRKSKDKILIFTTREYILQDATTTYEALNDSIIDFSKTIIDLNSYTKKIKANILYNHLFFADLPLTYLDQFIENRKYNAIIDHRNYSPRIIKECIQLINFKEYQPKEFVAHFIESLDNPFRLWEKPYNEQISNGSKILLLSLLTTGSTVLYEDLQKAFAHCAQLIGKKYQFHYSEMAFKYCLKEIDNTFTTTTKDDFGNIGIRFLNPSIQDYLIHYLEQNPELLYDITSCAIYFTQLFYLFTFDKDKTKKKHWWETRKILSSLELSELRTNIFIQQYDQLSDCHTTSFRYKESNKSRLERRKQSIYFYLNVANDEFSEYPNNKRLNLFIAQKMESKIKFTDSYYYTSDLNAYTQLLAAYKSELKIEPGAAMEIVLKNAFTLYHLIEPLKTLQTNFFDEFKIFSESNGFKEKANKLVKEELLKVTNDEIYSFREDLDTLQSDFGLDCSGYYKQLDKLIEEWGQNKEEEEAPIFKQKVERYTEQDFIDNMFYSLVNKARRSAKVDYEIADDLPF
jgi:hypothetical protein